MPTPLRAALLPALLFSSLTCCTPDDSAPPDAAPSDAARCTTDEACDDGVFCTGVERCEPASAGADARGCVSPTRAACFDGQICDEAARTCTTDCALATDADGDGATARECGGTDCDDADELRYPGATEICDPDARDEDCDPTTFGYRDADDDGAPDARCCNAATCGTDCNDADPAIRPGATEACNERDDDCDGASDEGAGVTCWVDADSDGYAPAGAESASICGACGAGRTSREPTDTMTTDCDDAVAAIRPGAADDQCDGLDNDCDDAVDETATMAAWRLFFTDADGDGFGAPGDLGTLACAATVPGRTLAPGDCDDAITTTHPGAPELCNRLVDDCSMWPSGAVTAPARSAEDADADGASAYGAPCEGGPLPRIDCVDDDTTRTHCDAVRHVVARERFRRVRVADLDADGDLDVVASSGAAVVALYNAGAGLSFTREPIDGTTGDASTGAPGLAIVDGDGDLDELSSLTALRGGDAGWYERTAPGAWTWHPIAPDRAYDFGASARPAADLDGDGWMEVATLDSGDLDVWTHGAAGTWARRGYGGTSSGAHPTFADVDGDGRLDLIHRDSSGIDAVLDPGAAGSRPSITLCYGGSTDLDLGDVQPDGRLDVIGLSALSSGLVLCTNPGAAGAWPDSPVGSTTTSDAEDLELVDLDGDGDGDVVLGGTHLRWLDRRGSTYVRHDLDLVGATGTRQYVAVGDVDGDGDLDVVLSNADVTGDEWLVWYEMSGGAFSPP
jgi:hypothetical protein